MNFVYRLYQDPDRPLKVTYAVILLYAFLALRITYYIVRTVVNILLYSYPQNYFYLVIDLIVSAIVFMIMLYVAKKIAEGRNWARWLLFIGFGLVLLTSLCNIRNYLAGDPLTGTLILGEILVTGLAVSLLFQQPSSDWFKSKSETAREEAAENDS